MPINNLSKLDIRGVDVCDNVDSRSMSLDVKVLFDHFFVFTIKMKFLLEWPNYS